ncbi:hypothetical protein CVM73_38535 [Bradyrhizobium forestalis]|uniref:Uncharacterized protein n=1 Tax=Bradyrhizobium forestalis TaxID=1419263 RepID=A0A2M8QWW5_9BRAD|nr:hypothetical protein [Bradyrhizobium forestalis]PJG50037.1 hypothetical protein CVM73_38535 [Bradyrhizobium forestalis]
MATEPKHFTKLSDAELRNRQLEIDDPHHQANLVNHIPEGVSPVRILNVYRFSKYPAEKAYCSKCEARRHRDGFTVELDDGSVAILGSKCGADLWGQSWHDIAADFGIELERAGIIIGFSRILPELKAVITALEKWRPTIRTVAKNQRQFQGVMPETFRRLRNAAVRVDRALMVHQQVRDLIKEAEYERRYGNAPSTPFYVMHERKVHELQGYAFFEHSNIEVLYDLALQDLAAAVEVGSNTQLHSQHKLRMHRAKLGDAMERLERVASAVRAVQLFYASDNLVRVAHWIERDMPGEEFEVGDHALTNLHSGRTVRMPQDYRMVDIEPARRLKKLSHGR